MAGGKGKAALKQIGKALYKISTPKLQAASKVANAIAPNTKVAKGLKKIALNKGGRAGKSSGGVASVASRLSKAGPVAEPN